MAVVILVAIALASSLAGCGVPETDPNARRRPDGEALFKDGRYAAAFSHAGPDGWRAFLQLRVRAGLIQEICFDAVNTAGQRLSENERYLEQFLLDHDLSLQDYLDGLVDQVLDSQLAVPVIRERALGWSVGFELLLRTALESARYGVTLDAAGIEQLPMPGPFTATDDPDELGWRGELVLVYDDNGVVAGHFRETREELDGSLRIKRDDAGYQERLQAASGVTSSEIADTLVRQLVASDSTQIDGVTGATLSTARFAGLAGKIDARRSAIPLPNDLCE